MRDCCDDSKEVTMTLLVHGTVFGDVRVNLERECSLCGDRGTMPVANAFGGHYHYCIPCAAKEVDK